MNDHDRTRAADFGPRLLFFSGGSALAPFCRELIRRTTRSIHLITPFDSGGSSAHLRRAFRMIAVGDLRNRLMALADHADPEADHLFRLLSHRLPPLGNKEAAMREMAPLLTGDGGERVGDALRTFFERAPDGFDYTGASVGNLVITGAYLSHARRIEPALSFYARLVNARGVVRPVANGNLDLAVRLTDGARIVGQKEITGALPAPVADVALLSGGSPVRPVIDRKTEKLIAAADLICYPVGSFITSLVANLLPVGVAETVARNRAPKVYVPNPTPDPEQVGHTLHGLVSMVRRAASSDGIVRRRQVLDVVLVDAERGVYPGGIDRRSLERMRVQVVDRPLIDGRWAPRVSPHLLADALMEIAGA
jgi:CofD-related protein of GAK system